jgi:phosphate/sulfate permease
MLIEVAWNTLGTGEFALLCLALVIAFGFEVINGFHDTANAVATVIYTKSLRPTPAVIWSGVCNFLGVLLGGIGVAYSIVHLLPVEILVDADRSAGLIMVLSILIAATLWNFGTWYLALPASSSHTLIGAILGVGLVHGLRAGQGLGGVNWTKAAEVGASLLISPLIGFGLAALLLYAARRLLTDPTLHQPPAGDRPPPPWIRAVLVTTCTGVSFAHGSNDGQKGMGLIMLIMIGLLPAHYALDMSYGPGQVREVATAAAEVKAALDQAKVSPTVGNPTAQDRLLARLADVEALLADRPSFNTLPAADRWKVRTALLEIQRELRKVEPQLPAQARAPIDAGIARLRGPIEYVPRWVALGVALSLGIGTTVGWKRIVVTVAEKIGKSHLTYTQGACAELVAMTTIGMADLGGLPVSTTHVLSSGIAGTMTASGSGLQGGTVKKIVLAWVLTLPAAMLLGGGLFFLGSLLGGS